MSSVDPFKVLYLPPPHENLIRIKESASASLHDGKSLSVIKPCKIIIFQAERDITDSLSDHIVDLTF